MSKLFPTASACYPLQLPPTEKDDRCNLIVRTGSASTLYNSLILTFGGLTIGLELYEWTIEELFNTFHQKTSQSNSCHKNITKYLSGELFYLNLIERQWSRVSLSESATRPRPRLFHEICAINNSIYVFGGLVKPDITETDIVDHTNFLVPNNELWEFDLESSSWTLLHDGSNYENDSGIPVPRFNHKMTTLNSLTFVNKKDHYGIFIAGGKDANSRPVYDNYVFDLVDKKYAKPIQLRVGSDEASLNLLNVDYSNSIIVNYSEEVEHHHHHHEVDATTKKSKHEYSRGTSQDESIIVYGPMDQSGQYDYENPLVSFKIGKTIKNGKHLVSHLKKPSKHSPQKKSQTFDRKPMNHTVPYNLRYPTGGLFGQNVVLTGFLPNDFDISIFIYNKPTGKWSRLNIFCNHDYGSHRFWGGFAWQSHHKVVVIGNYVTSKTTSSVRFFTTMITVSLPITNILASSELKESSHRGEDGKICHHNHNNDSNISKPKKEKLMDDSLTDESTCSSLLLERTTSEDEEEEFDDEDTKVSEAPELVRRQSRKTSTNSELSEKTSPNTISFTEYVHYAAPKTNFTKIRSVFPPAAITLGRNAFDRYGDLISDFELVSSNGDRIPVSLMVLMERWGRYFIQLLARGYVQAVDKFETDQQTGDGSNQQRLRTSKSNDSATSSFSSGTPKHHGFRSQSTSSGSSESSELKPHTEEATKDKLSYYMSIPIPSSKTPPKEAPQFRLPFQNASSTSSLVSGKDKTHMSSEDESEKRETTNMDKSSSVESNSSAPLAPTSSLPAGWDRPNFLSATSAADPHNQFPPRKDSVSSFSSNMSLLASHLQDIPPQLPLPSEQVPDVPATPISFRSSSRKNSSDHGSPRASLIHTLTALRNIPVSKSPRDSPFTSPRASISAQGGGNNHVQDLFNSPIPHLRPNQGRTSPGSGAGRSKSVDFSTPDYASNPNTSESISDSSNEISMKPLKSVSNLSVGSQEKDKKPSMTSSWHSETPSNNSSGRESLEGDFSGEFRSLGQKNYQSLFDNTLLNFDNIGSDKFKMEPSLIPRKLYVPFSTNTLKAFCEYLYTGQVGNKWLLTPTTLDNLAIAKFFKVPLFYDLISEVLFGVIGRKEAYIMKEGKRLKRRYYKLLELTGTKEDPGLTFPLNEYEGFLDTVDDGYLDITLMKKTSKIHKNSNASGLSSRKKKSLPTSEYSNNEQDIAEVDELLLQSSINEQKDLKEQEDNRQNQREQDNNEYGTSNEIVSDDENYTKSTSNSEDDNDFELGFLDIHENNTYSYGPRSKSVFDNAHTMNNEFMHQDVEENHSGDEDKDRVAGLTLDQLVTSTTSIPSDYVIDLIYEAAAIVIDMKLMLRAANARQMARILKKSRLEMEPVIEELTTKYREQKKQRSEKDADIGSALSSANPSRNISRDESPSEATRLQTSTSLKPSVSNSSLISTTSKPGLEKSRSNTSFRGIGSFTPFKPHKIDPKLGNKELDKRITKLIKKDEKLKSRTEKERQHNEKVEKQQQEKAKRAKKDTGTPPPPKSHGFLSRSSSRLNIDQQSDLSFKSASPTPMKKHHRFFATIGKNKEKDAESLPTGEFDPTKLRRTASSVASVTSSSSRKSDGSKKKKLGIFSLKLSKE